MGKRSRSRYRIIDTALLVSSLFRALSDRGKLLLLYLRSGPHTTSIPGLWAVGARAIAEQLDWSIGAFRKAFAELEAQGFARADWDVGIVLVPAVLDVDPPANPDVVRGWKSEWAELPDCALKTEVYHLFRDHCWERGDEFARAFGEACGDDEAAGRNDGHSGSHRVGHRAGEGPLHQEQNQEQNQGQDQGQDQEDDAVVTASRTPEAPARPIAMTVEKDGSFVLKALAITWHIFRPDDDRPAHEPKHVATLLRLEEVHGIEEVVTQAIRYLDDDEHVIEQKHPMELFISRFGQWPRRNYSLERRRNSTFLMEEES